MKHKPSGCRTAAAAAEGLVGAACGGWAWRLRPRARSAAVSPKCPHAVEAAAAAVHSEHHHRHVRGAWFRQAGAGAACGGWAWRPRPRARWAAVSPKCSHAAAAATGAVHSEHHHRRVSGVWFRQAGLPGTEHRSELEARVEKFIYACRFMTFLAIGGLLVGSVPCFLKGWVYVMDAFMEYYLHGGGKVILMLIEAIDMFLVGTVMFVFGTGLYELFISNMDMSYGSNLFGFFRLPERPKWLVIQSLNDLKTKLGHVIVMLQLVGIFEKSLRVTIASCTDLFCFAASIFLSSGCLYLLSRLHTTKGGSHA